MPPKKAAATAKAAVLGKDPATFDVAAWLNDLSERGFKPRNVTVKLHLRGDLLPRINELIQRIQDDAEIEQQVGINDHDPHAALVAEYNRLTAEFEDAGHLDFVFRPMTRRMHNATYQEWLTDHPGDGEHSEEEWDDLARRRMVETCLDFPGRSEAFPKLTTEALQAFEDAYGTPAFNTLVAGWNEAYLAGGEVQSPFSPKSSPTPDTAG